MDRCKRLISTSLFSVLSVCSLAKSATPAEQTHDMSAALAQANNPLANLQAFNIQNYFYPNISGLNATGDTLWLRYAQPVGKVLVRASMPFQNFPVTMQGLKKTGTGDFNAFATYLINTGNPAVSLGFGPLLVIPTASPSSLGAGKWQSGLAAVYFNSSSPKIQYGGLVTYQLDFSGPQNRQRTSIAAIQPFVILQVGKGYYLRSAPIWTANFVNHTGVLPLSLGIGKVFKKDRIVYNMFIEPQIAAVHSGFAQPLMQVYAGLNLQFYH